MSEAFLSVLNSSIAAVWGIAAVIILRLLLKKVPRKYICFLWALVAIRLVLPFSFESDLSLIPSAHTFQIVEKPRFLWMIQKRTGMKPALRMTQR